MPATVISIGTLPANSLWNERQPRRTGHATTTLIRSADRAILVDPGLPEQAIAARLEERTGLTPAEITHVFLTSFKTDTCRGIRPFDHATWWISEAERETVGAQAATLLKAGADQADPEVLRDLRAQVAILQRCKPAPDRLADGADLFPLAGVTPGLCGVLLPEASHTTLICGDAVPTAEHVARGQTLDRCTDVDQARESFQEALEIADLLICGRDNLMVNPLKRPF
jgi:glyoxylase-like metal-dependent hydrolase (beta-lactamase superfamily II)